MPGMGATKRIIPKSTIADSLAVGASVVGPMLGQGVIIRRPGVMRWAERLDTVQSAVRCMQRLEKKYGDGPLLLRVPGRKHALIFSTDNVRRVLEATPEPFATATREKIASLAHLQPEGALISHGDERDKRRHFNEEVLGNNQPVHCLAGQLLKVIETEVSDWLDTHPADTLDWASFTEFWFPLVQRLIFGEQARNDTGLREMIDRLRKDANWAFLHPKRDALREELHATMRAYLRQPERGSLAELIARMPADPDFMPEHQISHWMFAFDPAGMTVFRALAMLSSHPDYYRKAEREIETHSGENRAYLPFLRASILETLRLWPTTLVILRETTRDTQWDEGVLPKGTSIAIFAPYFHRDNKYVESPHQFIPERWEADQPADNWPWVPFSGGTGKCPARHLVLLVTSAALAVLVKKRRFRLKAPIPIDPAEPLPFTLNHFTLQFEPVMKG